MEDNGRSDACTGNNKMRTCLTACACRSTNKTNKQSKKDKAMVILDKHFTSSVRTIVESRNSGKKLYFSSDYGKEAIRGVCLFINSVCMEDFPTTGRLATEEVMIGGECRFLMSRNGLFMVDGKDVFTVGIDTSIPFVGYVKVCDVD